jgi:hypothetical protein
MASILKHSQEENVRDVHRLFYGVLGHGPRSCADAEIAAEVASLIQPARKQRLCKRQSSVAISWIETRVLQTEKEAGVGSMTNGTEVHRRVLWFGSIRSPQRGAGLLETPVRNV